MDREERQQWEQTRRKLSLQRKIEEKWKTKEMLLLTKTGKDVKREARLEEQWPRNREDSDKKTSPFREKNGLSFTKKKGKKMALKEKRW